MPNIVECPICDSKYDVSSVKDGAKLKCAKCQKVVGTIMGGNLLPNLEAIKPAGKSSVIKAPSGFEQKSPIPPQPELNPIEAQKPISSIEPDIQPTSRVSPVEEFEHIQPPSLTARPLPKPQAQPSATPGAATFQTNQDQLKGMLDEIAVSGEALQAPEARKPSTQTPVTIVLENPTEKQSGEKISFMLILAGIAGVAAIITLIYILLSIYQPKDESKLPVNASGKSLISDKDSG